MKLDQHRSLRVGQSSAHFFHRRSCRIAVTKTSGKRSQFAQLLREPGLELFIVGRQRIDESNHLAHSIEPLRKGRPIHWRAQVQPDFLDSQIAVVELLNCGLDGSTQGARLPSLNHLRDALALQVNPNGMQPVRGLCRQWNCALDEQARQIVERSEASDIDRQLVPAHDLQRHERRIRDSPTRNRHQFAALRSGFLGMPALEIARIDDPRIGFLHNFPSMDIAEREVVVALGIKRINSRGRLKIVSGASGKAGVQDADVELAGNCIRIVGYQILRHVTVWKAPAVQSDVKLLDFDHLGFE